MKDAVYQNSALKKLLQIMYSPSKNGLAVNLYLYIFNIAYNPFSGGCPYSRAPWIFFCINHHENSWKSFQVMYNYSEN